MKKGFTLIELLAAVTIIAILAGVAIPQYTRSVRRAEMAEGLTHGKTIYESALRYRATNGEFPTAFNQLDVSFIGAEVGSDTFDDGNFVYTLRQGGDGIAPHVNARSTKGDYEIRFIYPVRSTSSSGAVEGFIAPIACCPGESSNGQYVCRSAGRSYEELEDDAKTLVTSACLAIM